MYSLLLVCCFASIEFFPLNSSQFISSHRHIQHLISCCHSECSRGWFYSNPSTPSCHQVPPCTAVKTWWQLQSWPLAQKGCELRPRFKKELMASLGAGPPGKGAALGTWEEGGRVRVSANSMWKCQGKETPAADTEGPAESSGESSVGVSRNQEKRLLEGWRRHCHGERWGERWHGAAIQEITRVWREQETSSEGDSVHKEMTEQADVQYRRRHAGAGSWMGEFPVLLYSPTLLWRRPGKLWLAEFIQGKDF